MEFVASWLFWFLVLFLRGAIRFSRFSFPISPVLGHNVIMDEKREMLMKLLLGSDDGDPGQTSAPTVSPRQLQRWQKVTQKAQKVNETLDSSQKSANILRGMMHKD